jgi:transcriptional regulator with XRE-family HTH domain
MKRNPPTSFGTETLFALGQVIKDKRRMAGLTQEKVAELGDFDRTYISMLERGKRNLSFLNLCRIANLLKTRPSELLSSMHL